MQMTSIKFDEVEFYQTPDKGKTVAVASGHALDALIDFCAKSNQSPPADYMDIPEELMMPNEIKAISTCHSPDKWDDETGRKQAFYKLVRMYNKMKNRAVTRYIDRCTSNINALNYLVTDYTKRVSTYDRLVRYPKGSKKG